MDSFSTPKKREYYIPKEDLKNGAKYEGVFGEKTMVAVWDASLNYFVGTYHSWEETWEITLSHPTDQNEYFGVFYPYGVQE